VERVDLSETTRRHNPQARILSCEIILSKFNENPFFTEVKFCSDLFSCLWGEKNCMLHVLPGLVNCLIQFLPFLFITLDRYYGTLNSVVQSKQNFIDHASGITDEWYISMQLDFLFVCLNPLLFASCTDTFSKWCKITRGMKSSAQ
jgi:hypothetical protein